MSDRWVTFGEGSSKMDGLSFSLKVASISQSHRYAFCKTQITSGSRCFSVLQLLTSVICLTRLVAT